MFKAKNYSLPLNKTYVMAIINLTPDSFFEGSRCTAEEAVKRAVEAVEQGADILDLGAQSTAPTSVPISAEEEIGRLIEPLKAIRQAVDVPISVDTYYTQVAEAALKNGADIINDVSGKAACEMARLVKEYDAGWIIMHTGGLLSSEQGEYKNGIIAEINAFFASAAESSGIDTAHLCFDSGIGFGKSREDDLAVIAAYSQLDTLGSANLLGLSRKRVTRLSGDALTGTVAANTACILGGANIIRVHDVCQGKATAAMADLIKGKN